MLRRKATLIIVFLFLLIFITAAAEAKTSISDFKAFTGNKIDILQAEKDNITPAMQKLSTDLLQLIDKNQLPPGQSREELQNQMKALKQFRQAGPVVNSDGVRASGGDMVYVYIYLKPAFDTHVIDPHVCKVTDRDEENRLAVAWVDVNNLETLASLDAVRAIRTVEPPVARTGSVTSEGDAIHRADQVRAIGGNNGSGIKVGIISDGVDHKQDSINKGDLPSNLCVLSNTVGGDEGTAMLEIVHDLAPGAQLYFHDCGKNTVAFNSAVDKLVSAGCKVICDDIGWLAEPCFEDGIVARHITQVLAQNNIVYVSSAGNQAGEHYQGLYYNDGNNYHDFSRGTSNYKKLYIEFSPGSHTKVFLQWDDKCGSSGNDYDLYLRDYYTGNVVAKSTNTQDGSGDPLEAVYVENTGSAKGLCYAEVVNHQGKADPRTLEVYIYGTALVLLDNITPVDSIFGHPAVPDVIATGAIDFPNSNQIAEYSCLGPVTIKYPSPEVRAKPDMCGMAGVAITGAGGFSNPFYGTSAAAPHVAAIAALAWSKSPGKTAADIRSALKSTAIDLGSNGFDYVYGYGRADALNANNAISGGGGDTGKVTAVSIAADKASPQPAGTTVTFTASATGSGSPLYQFWVKNPSGGWTSSGSYSSVNTYQLTNTMTGTYTVDVYAMAAGASEWQAFREATFTFTSGGGQAVSVNLTPDMSSPQPVGTKVTFKATSTGIRNPMYKYWVQWPDGIWESPGSYTTDTYLWIESGITGTCVVLALVKDAYSSEPQAGSVATLFKYTGAYGRLEDHQWGLSVCHTKGANMM